MKTAREMMTKDVRCVRAGDSVVEAAQQMAALNVGAMPICGENNRLQGMLTDRDIVIKVVAKGKDPLSVKAGELGEGAPVTVDVNASAQQVISLMGQHQVRRLPVLEDHQLVGIIAQADIACELDNDQTGSFVEAVSTDF